jgi:hypothetical protein
MNKDHCPCTYPCDKHDNCKACVALHRPHGEFPACFFSSEAEKRYDRSFKNLCEDRKE